MILKPVKSALLVVVATALAVLAISCGASPPASIAAPTQLPTPTPAPPVTQPASVAGTWTGTGVDSQGSTTVTWTLTQTGASASGTVKTEAINPNDGSCNSCHRNKSGTFSGTMSETTLTMTMVFAAGVDGDPTPACNATLTGTASPVAGDTLTASYAGADSCEGAFLNGTFTMARAR